MVLYKVSCEFYVKGDSVKQVENYYASETDFVENHVMVDQVEVADIQTIEIEDDLRNQEI